MSSANDSCRETDRGSNCVEICFDMFFRYVVGETANPRTPDVPLHVHSYVCPHVVAFPKSGRLLPPFLQKSPYERAHTHHRPRLLFLEAPHPVTTSTREILLSP